MKVCRDCLRCYDDIVASCVFQEHSTLSQTRAFSCEVVAGYRLESVIECGPQSEIYRARQIEFGRSCLITIRTADPVGAERFLIDAQAAAMLFQPGVADVYESGTLASGEVYVVTEDTEGQPLRQFLDKNGIPPLLESVSIIRQTAAALHAIHKKGLLHRAVRPENIVLTTGPAGELNVRIQHLDMGGLAQHSTVSNKFLIDSALDTLRYFAPEQSSGEDASARTDVYSLGIVFYEMLTGAPPFDDTKATALIEKHRNQQPPDVKINNFELRMLVTHALFESLQKRPEARQSTADLLARQLRHVEQLATYVSTPPPAGTHAVSSAPPAASSTPNVTSPSASAGARLRNNMPPTGFVSGCEVIAVEPKVPFEAERDPEPQPVAIREPEPPVAHFPTPHEPKRSRLKVHRKRTHSVYVASRHSEHIMPELSETPRHEPARVTSRAAAAPSSQNFPKKVGWDQPDDDIPTLETLMVALSSEERNEISFDELEMREAEVNQIFNDAKAANHAVSTKTHAQTAELPQTIAVTEPPSRIEIDLEHPAFRPFSTYSAVSPDELDLFPAFQTGPKTVPASGYSVFTAYTKPANASRSFSHRTVMVGVGFAALLGFFLFGYEAVNQNMQVAGKKDILATSTTTEDNETQRIDQATINKDLPKASEPPSTEEPLPQFQAAEVSADPTRTKPVAVKEVTKPKIEKPLVPTNKAAARSAMEPSTLVISSDKGAVKTWTEPAKRSSQSSGKGGVTRPRVVANPKP